MSTDDKKEIKKLHENGVSIAEIAKKFNVKRTTIYYHLGLFRSNKRTALSKMKG